MSLQSTMKAKKILCLAIVLISIPIISCFWLGLFTEKNTRNGYGGGEPSVPVEMNLSFVINKNKTVDINVTAKSLDAHPNGTLASLEIIVPEGFQLISGLPKVEAHLYENETISMQYTIRSVKEGKWTVSVKYESRQGRKFRGIDLEVSKTGDISEWTPPWSRKIGKRDVEGVAIPSN